MSASFATIFAAADVAGSVITAVAALIGTLLVQVVYARRHARAAHLDAQRERLRQDRLTIYGDFAGALMRYRHTQLARWHAEHDGRSTEIRTGEPQTDQKIAEIKQDARSQRATAWDHFYRVQLVADDGEIVDQARAALDEARAISDGGSAKEVARRADAVQDQRVADFVRRAQLQIVRFNGEGGA